MMSVALGRPKESTGVRVEVSRDPASWDAYVDRSPGALMYHRWVWRELVQETFGHQAFYLAAGSDGEIAGVLPLFLVKSRLFGRSLVSVPLSTYGGVLSDSSDAAQALLTGARELARECGARHVELRQVNCLEMELPAWSDLTPKVMVEVPLPTSAEEFWTKLSTGMRNKIRSAEKQGLRSETGGSEAISVFYRIFAANMRNLGTPVYPRAWFENLARRLRDQACFLSVWEGSQPIGAGMVIRDRNGAEWPWSATLPEFRRKYSAVYLHWKLFEWAIKNGCRRVDLGRSTPGSGTHMFKRHWPSEERPAHWYYWLAEGGSAPRVGADNPRFRVATEIWKRLPLFVANSLGPRIVRSFP
jgi:FemAB-related protein (PEP-CTERM system-associated)